jgi:hypothetical protein
LDELLDSLGSSVQLPFVVVLTFLEFMTFINGDFVCRHAVVNALLKLAELH